MRRACLQIVSYFAACLGLLAAAEPPSEKLIKHLGKIPVEYLSRVERIEAFRVGKLDSTKLGADDNVGGREVLGKPIPVPKAVGERLIAALLTEETYLKGDSKGTVTGVGYRLWTTNTECLEFSTCLKKGNVWIVAKDAGGKVVASGDRRGFRDDKDSPIRAIAAELFPDDKDVQAAKPSSKKE